MKVKYCKKCGGEFPQSAIINGERKSLDKRKFCLSCSPFGKHNTKDITKYQSYIFEENGIKYKKCPSCNQILKLDKENYFIRKNESFHYYCKSCLNKRTLEFQIKRKDECIEYKGGKCIVCEYNKCRNALEFHHIDSESKDFDIGTKMRKYNFEIIKKELDKCVLLCSNCHREVHAKSIILNL